MKTGNTNASSILPVAERMEILPHYLYRSAWLKKSLGRRCIEALRVAGLRPVGGWYLGKTVLETFERAWETKSRQRVPEGKEVSFEKEHEKKTHAMEKSADVEKIQPTPKPERSNPLVRQMEAFEREMG